MTGSSRLIVLGACCWLQGAAVRLARQAPDVAEVVQLARSAKKAVSGVNLEPLGPFAVSSNSIAARLPSDEPSKVWGEDKLKMFSAMGGTDGTSFHAGAFSSAGTDAKSKAHALYGVGYDGLNDLDEGTLPSFGMVGVAKADPGHLEVVNAFPSERGGVDYGQLKVALTKGHITPEQLPWGKHRSAGPDAGAPLAPAEEAKRQEPQAPQPQKQPSWLPPHARKAASKDVQRDAAAVQREEARRAAAHEAAMRERERKAEEQRQRREQQRILEEEMGQAMENNRIYAEEEARRAAAAKAKQAEQAAERKQAEAAEAERRRAAEEAERRRAAEEAARMAEEQRKEAAQKEAQAQKDLVKRAEEEFRNQHPKAAPVAARPAAGPPAQDWFAGVGKAIQDWNNRPAAPQQARAPFAFQPPTPEQLERGRDFVKRLLAQVKPPSPEEVEKGKEFFKKLGAARKAKAKGWSVFPGAGDNKQGQGLLRKIQDAVAAAAAATPQSKGPGKA